MTTGTRWLIVCLEGVAADDLTKGATPRLAGELCSDHALPNLQWPSGGACIDRWLELLDAEQLRLSGMTVDIRSLLLSPGWRSDESTLQQLGRRPSGPAEITCIRLREQARVGMQQGLRSQAHVSSLARMDSYLDRAREILEVGPVDLRCLILTYAPLVPVQRCFDAEHHLLASLPRSVTRGLELQQTPALLRVHFTANEAMDRAAKILERAPAKNHGRLLDLEEIESAGIDLSPQECIFAPRDGVAFHNRALKAAPSLLTISDRSACALMPWTTDGRRSMSIHDVAGRFLTELGSGQEVKIASEHTESPAIDLHAAYPDLEHLFATIQRVS